MPGIEHVLFNPFLKATAGSALRAAALGMFTDDVLSAHSSEPAIAALYNEYHPVWKAYSDCYNGRFYALGMGKSKTQSLQEAVAGLSDDIKEWGLAIERVHRRDTPGYQKLLPNGRRAFRQGRMSTRIAAVGSLVLALQDNEPLLAALLPVVQEKATLLADLRLAAEGAQSAKNGKRLALKTLRLDLCRALYSVLGGLIHLYPDNPERVSNFFDVATMHRRRHRKKSDTATDEAAA